MILGLGRSPGEGNGYPLQYSGLENSMDYIVHGVAKSRTQLSDFHSLILTQTAFIYVSNIFLLINSTFIFFKYPDGSFEEINSYKLDNFSAGPEKTVRK